MKNAWYLVLFIGIVLAVMQIREHLRPCPQDDPLGLMQECNRPADPGI